MSDRAWLVLQNGRVFAGRRFGAFGQVTAELVFTTGMNGYLETLTDPSYYGQMVVQTFPLIGNYGVIPADFESDRPRLSGYIVREWCDAPSNFRSAGRIDEYLQKTGVVGLCDLDTRALTRVIREYGTMNAAIVDKCPDDPAAFGAKLAGENLSSDIYDVTCDAVHALNDNGQFHVVLWDFGFKMGMARAMIERDCRVTVVPARTSAEHVLALKPDGVLLSNGPGDPAAFPDVAACINKVVESRIPTFGICMGHQLLGIARGGRTLKLKYGHRGVNQPVRDTESGRLIVTSQNHGYAIDTTCLPPSSRLSYVNIDDNTCEGLDYDDIPAFSVQFHPEACSGPTDASFLFDRFLNMMKRSSFD